MRNAGWAKYYKGGQKRHKHHARMKGESHNAAAAEVYQALVLIPRPLFYPSGCPHLVRRWRNSRDELNHSTRRASTGVTVSPAGRHPQRRHLSPLVDAAARAMHRHAGARFRTNDKNKHSKTRGAHRQEEKTPPNDCRLDVRSLGPQATRLDLNGLLSSFSRSERRKSRRNTPLPLDPAS